MITVERELYPEDQDESLNVCQPANSAHPIYTSSEGVSMLELRMGASTSQMWRSEDNGVTWELADEIPMESETSDGRFAETSYGPLYRDPDNDRIVRFQQQWLFTAPKSERKTYYDLMRTRIENSCRAQYEVSSDGGRSWGELHQLVEEGDGYDALHWAKDVTFGEGSAILGAPPPFTKLADGRIVIPCQIRTPADVETHGTIQAGRFYGTWNDVWADLSWRSGGRVPGGGCEQAAAVLKDGRMINIMRVQGQVEPYPFDLWLRPYSLSEDGGETWSEPRALTYDDGGGLTSPRAWSVLIRSEKNDRLYWIANILPALETEASAEIRERYPMRADPRYPLAIVEVDEDTVTLKRDTLTVIQNREPHMPHWVRFSNYFVYNERETGDLRLVMLTSYCELQEDRMELPWPSYRYRIRPGE
ncbi:MAG: sialidase family protein [Candidatus Latescibacteria bacterium]|nr:sialidase family protein [Candidatus Latescibacterota bacterium]